MTASTSAHAPRDVEKIRVHDLHKTFATRAGKLTALAGIELVVSDGEFLVLLGPSGCGKSTLLRILADLEKPSSGEVTISRSAADRPMNSMVFQQESVFPWMTVEHNVEYGLRMRGVARDRRRALVSHYVGKAGLTGYESLYPHQLSGGMKQRVSVARAFANDPEILLMDEPFAALDEQNKTLLQEELLRIWEENKKTVVYVTHSIEEAIGLGDRIVLMTASPGRFTATYDIDFPRPRDMYELRRQPAFGELAYEIWGVLRAEVDAARRKQAEGSTARRA